MCQTIANFTFYCRSVVLGIFLSHEMTNETRSYKIKVESVTGKIRWKSQCVKPPGGGDIGVGRRSPQDLRSTIE